MSSQELIREQILAGDLGFVGSKLYELYPDNEADIDRFWKAIWLSYLNGQEANGVKWYNELGGKLYNDMTRRLSANGWIECNALPARKWLSVKLLDDKLLEFVTTDELIEVKCKYKYKKYTMDYKESKASKLVRQNGQTKVTGLVRYGFRDAGNTEFGFDFSKLGEYRDAVEKNLVKSMDKVREFFPEMGTEDYSYDKVSIGIYELMSENPLITYTTGDSISDSRGRAISQCLKNVANPISSKDFRAALVITYEEE